MLFRLNDVYKSFGGKEILKGISFQINPFEKVGLVGRNGAGKTSAFRLITGEESADAGEIARAKDLKIGLLEQHVDFSENETVHTAALSAFKKLHDIEARLRLLEKRMAADASEEILNEYADLQIEFEREGGFEYTARAESILLGLNFEKETWTLETDKLSGGQKNRLGMVRLLLSDADVLLLDEPTNHLDVETVEWLEEYLLKFEKAHVIISHDRYFLDKTCTKIVEIENGKAYTYQGNYSKYVAESALQKEQRQREFENQQAYIRKTESFIRKNLAGQKTKQAKSRRTLLQRMDRLEAVEKDKTSSNFNLEKVERTGANVLSVDGLKIGYPQKTLAEGIDFVLHRGECLGVIGGNGTGKTTFLKTILGTLRELSGKILWGTKVSIGYYSQQLEELDLQISILDELRKVAPSAETGDLRSFLAGFLFFGEDVFKKVGDLSGGEKGRLSLAKLIYSKANVLILDEPTNHLDIPSREALESALDEFDGTIITVSHDRYFLDRLAAQILSFEKNGKTEIFTGNYSEYFEWKKARLDTAGRRTAAVVEKSNPDAVRTENDSAADVKSDSQASETDSQKSATENLSKNERRKIEQRIREIEKEIARSEDDLKKITFEMSDPQTVSDSERYKEINIRYQSIEKSVQNLYAEWEGLLEKVS